MSTELQILGFWQYTRHSVNKVLGSKNCPPKFPLLLNKSLQCTTLWFFLFLITVWLMFLKISEHRELNGGKKVHSVLKTELSEDYGMWMCSVYFKESFSISFKESNIRFWVLVIVITQFIQITRPLLAGILATLCASVQIVNDNQPQLLLTQDLKNCSMMYSLNSYNYV